MGDTREGDGSAGSRGGMHSRLMAWFVGGPPKGPRTYHMVMLVLGVLLLIWQVYLALGQDGQPLVTRLYILPLVFGAALLSLGSLLYGWRRAVADLLRLAGNLFMCAGIFVLLPVGLWQAGERGWFWYAVAVYAAITVVAVLYSYHKRSEDAGGRSSPTGRRAG